MAGDLVGMRNAKTAGANPDALWNRVDFWKCTIAYMVVAYSDRFKDEATAITVLHELKTLGADFDKVCPDQYGRSPVVE